MMFQHLATLYAQYYMALKKFEKSGVDDGLATAKKAYLQTLRDIEIYIETIGIEGLESSENQLINRLVYDPKKEGRFGKIFEHSTSGWGIEWFDRNNLKFIKKQYYESLANLKVLSE